MEGGHNIFDIINILEVEPCWVFDILFGFNNTNKTWSD